MDRHARAASFLALGIAFLAVLPMLVPSSWHALIGVGMITLAAILSRLVILSYRRGHAEGRRCAMDEMRRVVRDVSGD